MNENIYAAPQAQLIDSPAVEAIRDPFYVVSMLKFNLLFFLTMGLYSVYWFYRHWKAWKIQSGRDLWPVPRSIFSIFFAHSLFALFEQSRTNPGKNNGALWATLYVVAALLSNITSALGGDELSRWDLASYGCLLLMGIALGHGQKVANDACVDPLGSRNAHFSAANIVWMVIGSLFWLLILAVAAMMIFIPGLAEG